MNKMSLEKFKNELDQVRKYLQNIEYVNNLVNYLSNEPEQNLFINLQELERLKEYYKNFSTHKKIFEYKAAIISLYGLLEKYIETWIKDYLDSISTLTSKYSEIDKKITENHFDQSLKLINTISDRELPKYQHLTKEQVLIRLNQCITDTEDYSFNTEAFVISSGNLKHKQIAKLFQLINVELNGLLSKNETLFGHNNDEIQTQSIKIVEPDILYGIINDLVERRNEIAHGSEVANILSKSELEPFINFLEKYCQAIFEILTEQLIKKNYISFKK